MGLRVSVILRIRGTRAGALGSVDLALPVWDPHEP